MAAQLRSVVIDAKSEPTHPAHAIDGIGNTGSLGAHPVKSKNTGLVLPVEPGEAERNLDTLSGLFDFYFVQPASLAAKLAALDAKLKRAGKPPLE